MKSIKVLVTGASGFIGRALCQLLLDQAYAVCGLVRGTRDAVPGVEYVEADLDSTGGVGAACQGIDFIVHLAGRAHIFDELEANPLELFRRTNCEATLRLAEQALAAGVRRFIFISSIGVNGAQNSSNPFYESSAPRPHADYALSKFEAEKGLIELLAGSGMELVIIRPPLVYGGHAPGNFQRLLELVATGVPLPFAMVNNRRSMVALENLIDFIVLCVKQPAAANQLFLVSDGVDVSTPDIVRHLAAGIGRTPLLFPVPPKLMEWASRLVGKQAMYTQLCGSLVIDSSKARQLLDWQPPVSTVSALEKAGRDYMLRAQG